MSKMILAFDNEDVELGDFFLACGQDLTTFLEERGVQTIVLRSNNISEASIQIVTQPHPMFLFGAYSHGSENSLVIKSVPYISSTINIGAFNSSFFYACACHTGKTLGQDLINNGCRSFIGYNNKFSVWGYNQSPFIECANHGLKEFIDGKTVGQVVDSMKAKYTQHIDNYNNDIFGAAFLVDNRNSIVWHGEDISYSMLQ